MTNVQHMLHVLMLEREMETYEQNPSPFYGPDSITESARKPMKKRSTGFIDRLRRLKLAITPSERAVSNQCCCRTDKRSLEPVISQCSSLNSGGSK